MNLNLFLIILIALIIIFCIILYIGLRIMLTIEKEKGIVKYEFKVTILKIPIFKRTDTKRILDLAKSKDKDEDLEENKEDSSKTKEESSKSEDKKSKVKNEDSKVESKSSEEKIKESKEESTEKDDEKSKESEDEKTEKEDKKSLREKYNEIKPILQKLKLSKEELKSFLKNILKAINLKKLEGNLIIGLSDHTTTIKIASWIWSIGAIINSKKPTLLTVEPRFTEVVMDFEGKIELKINLLILLIYSLFLLTKKNIRELIIEIYRQNKSKDKEQENKSQEEEAVAKN